MALTMEIKTYKLNPSAFIVKGASRSLLCDLERENFWLIPSVLQEILEDETLKSIEDVKMKYGSDDLEHSSIIDDYFVFLHEKDLILYSNYLEMYPKMKLTWHSNSHVTNAIIDVEENSNFNFELIFKQLDELNCRDIQIRFFIHQTAKEIELLLDSAESTCIKSIQFIIPFIGHKEIENLKSICKSYPRVSYIQCYGNIDNKVHYTSDDQLCNLVTINADLKSNKHCGIIESPYFVSDITTFTESQHHNTCLNRKISIDVDGNIKNCPSMVQSFGNIRDTTLQEALEHPDFKKYWNVKKDDIAVCKDCEFRHICTDCRAYIENPDDMYSKPLKCGYNPYTAEWEEWSTNPLKQKAIEHYGMQDFVLKSQKL